MTGALQELVESLIGDGAATAAAAVIGDRRGVRAEAWAGWRRWAARSPLEAGDRFDLASLTKPATATLALALAARGELPLTASLGEIWGHRCAPEVGGVPLESLLRHRGGYRAWHPLYHHAGGRERAARFLLEGEALGAPPGTYSDLGYLLWGFSAERQTGRALGELLRELLGHLEGGGLAGASEPERCVECRLDNRREIELAAAQGISLPPAGPPRPGETQDGNARRLGGVAGHAGLFGSARAVWALAREWLRPGELLSARSVERALGGEGSYALGWARPASWSAGGELPEDAFGHLGFTGGCVWVLPGRDRIGVLLCHRSSTESDLGPWRRRLVRMLLQ